MTSPAPRLRLLDVALYERPVRFRIPYGHNYVDGMAGALEEEQLRFLTWHPDLYRRDERRRDERVRLAIRDGALALGSLVTPGLGVGVMPDWSAMQVMEG
jgi:DNA-binding transcriptional LysR family regulator